MRDPWPWPNMDPSLLLSRGWNPRFLWQLRPLESRYGYVSCFFFFGSCGGLNHFGDFSYCTSVDRCFAALSFSLRPPELSKVEGALDTNLPNLLSGRVWIVGPRIFSKIAVVVFICFFLDLRVVSWAELSLFFIYVLDPWNFICGNFCCKTLTFFPIINVIFNKKNLNFAFLINNIAYCTNMYIYIYIYTYKLF